MSTSQIVQEAPGKRILVWGRQGAPLGVNDCSTNIMTPLDISSHFDDNRIIQLCGGSQHCIALTINGTVYGWGQGSCGQLGNGESLDRPLPEVIKSVTLWNATFGRKVLKVSVGELHTMFACSDGQVFAVGDNTETFLGIGQKPESLLHPRLILTLAPEKTPNSENTQKVNAEDQTNDNKDQDEQQITKAKNTTETHSKCGIDIDSLGRHSLAVNREGKTYSWGISTNGQLGHGNLDSQYIPRPIVSLDNIKITQVQCGWNHSLCLSDDGIVFAFGSGSEGKLGLGNDLDFPVPFPINYFIKNNVKIQRICAGHFHSAAVDQKGALWTWGSGSSGVLGHGTFQHHFYPKKVSIWYKSTTNQSSTQNVTNSDNNRSSVGLKPIENDDQKSNDQNTSADVALSDQNGSDATTSTTPTYVVQDQSERIQEVDEIVSVACGAFHMLVSTKEGSCYSWGKGDTCALGHGHSNDILFPTQIVSLQSMKVSAVSCGMNHSMAVVDIGAEEQESIERARIKRPRAPIQQNDISNQVNSESKSNQIQSNSDRPSSTQENDQKTSAISNAMNDTTTFDSGPAVKTENDQSLESESKPKKSLSFEDITALNPIEPSEEKSKTPLSLKYLFLPKKNNQKNSTNSNQQSDKSSNSSNPSSISTSFEKAIKPATETKKMAKEPTTDHNPVVSGPEPAPMSKPMKISPNRRKSVVYHEPDMDEFPDIAGTWVATVIDTREYLNASVMVGAEVAKLRQLLDARKEKVSKENHRVQEDDNDDDDDEADDQEHSEGVEKRTSNLRGGRSNIQNPTNKSNPNIRRSFDGLSDTFDDKFAIKTVDLKESSQIPFKMDMSTEISKFSSSGLASSVPTASSSSPSVKFGFAVRVSDGIIVDPLDSLYMPTNDLNGGYAVDISELDDNTSEAQNEPINFNDYEPDVDGFVEITDTSQSLSQSLPIESSLGNLRLSSKLVFPQRNKANASPRGSPMAKRGTQTSPSKKKVKSATTNNTSASRFAQIFVNMFVPERDRVDLAQYEINKKTTADENAADYWLMEVIPNWDSIKKTTKMKRMWRRGVPANIRGVVWNFLITNNLDIDYNSYEQASRISKAKYQEWLNGQHDTKKKGQSIFHVIDVDVPRTHPETKLFKPGGPFYNDLVNLLQVYAHYQSDLSYVQGMSYLAAFFITHMDAFAAFKCFANLINTHFYLSLFKMDITQILRHMLAYGLLFERHMPALYAHFTKQGIAPEQYLLDWFMTCFGRAFSLQTSSRIFDCLIIEGEVFLYRTALAILKLSEKTLLNLEFEKILPLFRVLPRELDEDTVFATIKNIKVPREVRNYIKRLDQETDRR